MIEDIICMLFIVYQQSQFEGFLVFGKSF